MLYSKKKHRETQIRLNGKTILIVTFIFRMHGEWSYFGVLVPTVRDIIHC